MKILLQQNKIPEIGDTRQKRSFAWFPIKVIDYFSGNEYLIWLTWFIKNQRFKEVPEGAYLTKNKWVTCSRTFNARK